MRTPIDREVEVQLNNCNNMKLYHIKLLSFLLSVFLTSCKESTDTPPFVFQCQVKLVNEDGSLPLKENKDKISEITINLIKPTDNNAQIENMFYLDYDGCLNIQILDRKVTIKNDGNYDQEYRLEIQYPEEIRRRKDTIRVKYRFKDYRPSIIEAFYNDKKPQYMGTDVTYFEVEN